MSIFVITVIDLPQSMCVCQHQTVLVFIQYLSVNAEVVIDCA